MNGRLPVVWLVGLAMLSMLVSCAGGQQQPAKSTQPSAAGTPQASSSAASVLTTIPAAVHFFPIGTSQNDGLTVKLFSDHDPPSLYEHNLFEALITDSQGQPILEASVVFIVNMVDMDMGRNDFSAVLTADGYHAGPIDYSMLGLWRVTVNIYRRGHTTNVDVDFII